MSSSKKLNHCVILLSVLILSACQMPVRPDKAAQHDIPPAAAEPPTSNPDAITSREPETGIDSAVAIEPAPVETPAIAGSTNTQTGAAVFARLSNNFSGPLCNDSAAINQWKKRYAGNPKSFSNHLGEILPLLDYVSIEIERRKLPAEFALIPIIESWYQPHAVGAGGPAGMWQMIGTTAKNHGIKIQSGYDGRFSVVDSTDAALSYLGTLQGMFKDWQRAVMGYNAGEFRVLRAIRSSGNKNEGLDHWPHGLSPITYAYIAKLQALSCLISQPGKNNLSLPVSTEFTPLAAILVDADSGSLDNIAKRFQLDAERLKQNNPAYKRGQISAQTPRRILMPAYLANSSFVVADTGPVPAADKPAPAGSDTVIVENTGNHEVKNGETLWSIAKLYGLSLESLRKINGLGRRSILRVGQSLKLTP